MTLQTVKSKQLRQITIVSRIILVAPVREMALQGWRDLDRLLLQLWISHLILPKFSLREREGGADLGGFAQSLLPELTNRGIVDLVLVPFNLA